MKERLEEILNNYDEQLQRYERDLAKLEAKIDFCTEHKLDEEKRICLVKWEELNMCVYRWRNMHNDLNEMLNKWRS